MSLYNGPPRPGARGGRDQFNWEDVKSDKDREFYLGHSVKATTGRWQKGRDVYWYTRAKNDSENVAEEVKRVKEREQQLMLEALGLKPKTQHQDSQLNLDKGDLQQLLRKSSTDQETEQGADRIQGVGFGQGPNLQGMEHEVHEVLQGTGTAGFAESSRRGGAIPPGNPAQGVVEGQRERVAALTASHPSDQDERRRKKSKKRKKEERKPDRKIKKAKKHKKESSKHRSKSNKGGTGS